MPRHIVTLANDRIRERAIGYIRAAKPNSRVEFKGPKRSNDQNAAMWAMLSDLAEQLRWHGQQLSAEDYKLVMVDALHREHRDQLRLVPNTDNTGFVNISKTSSSDLTHEEMSDLLTIIRAFGDQHQVEWSEPKPKGGDDRPLPPIDVYEEAS